MSMEDIEIRDQCYAEWKAMKQTKQACSECDSPMTNMSMSGRLPDWVCQECCLHDENDHGYCLAAKTSSMIWLEKQTF